MIANAIIFLVIAIVGGFGSSWYMIERGSPLTTRTSGAWTTWLTAGRSDADPYTRAHFMRRGMMPETSALAITFEAITDDTGELLHSSCEYKLLGTEPPARFWSISVFDHNGELIPNEAERYSYNSETVLRASNKRLEISLSRSARPGNWLPTAGAGRFTLVMTVEDLQLADPGSSWPWTWRPPQVRRTSCR
ncbi:MAG: DUF1214 domain-containing protein [Hyphomicrobiaceae bacterium]